MTPPLPAPGGFDAEVGIRGRAHDAVTRPVRVLLHVRHVLARDETAAEAPVQRRLVQDGRVLDVVARVGHDGDDRVLTTRQLVEVHHVQHPTRHQRFLGSDKQIMPLENNEIF